MSTSKSYIADVRSRYLKQLNEIGLADMESYQSEAFSRNIGLLSPGEQLEISTARVAIPGLGGVGGLHAMTLARCGITKFHLADFDQFEVANINRQYGARVPNLGRKKLDVMTEDLLSVNPFVEVVPFPEGLNEDNLDAFLDGVQVVVDSLDAFVFDIRRLLFNRARERGIYVISAGPLGFSAAYLIFSPKSGMSFDDYIGFKADMTQEERSFAFLMGVGVDGGHLRYMSGVDLSKKRGPSSALACSLCAGVAAIEVIRIITKRGEPLTAPHYGRFDPYTRVFKNGYLMGGSGNPWRRFILKQYKKSLNRKHLQIPQVPARVVGQSIPEPVIDYVIDAGIRAPSGDNTQPWRIKRDNNEIWLSIDQGADGSLFNKGQYALIISAGAAFESMRIAALGRGLIANPEYVFDDRGSGLMAKLNLAPLGESAIQPLEDAIWRRHTNRTMYDERPLLPTSEEFLHQSLSEVKEAVLCLLTSREEIARSARAVFVADRLRSQRQDAHEFLFDSIRWTEKDAQATKTGLPIANLEVGLPGEMLLRLLRSWRVTNALNKIGLDRLIAKIASQGVMQSSAVGLITVPSATSPDLFHGGRAFLRIWLACTHLGLDLQPLAGPTLLTLIFKKFSQEIHSKKEQNLFAQAQAAYEVCFPGANLAERQGVMMFRLGYGKRIRRHTERKHRDAFVLA